MGGEGANRRGGTAERGGESHMWEGEGVRFKNLYKKSNLKVDFFFIILKLLGLFILGILKKFWHIKISLKSNIILKLLGLFILGIFKKILGNFLGLKWKLYLCMETFIYE